MRNGICYSKPVQYKFLQWTGTNIKAVKAFIHPSYKVLVEDKVLRLYMNNSSTFITFTPGNYLLECQHTKSIYWASEGTFATMYTLENPICPSK